MPDKIIMTKALQLSWDEINRLFPFFILINGDAVIELQGDSVKKIMGDCIGKSMAHVFEFERPNVNTIDYDTLFNLQHEMVILKTKTERPISYRGQIEHLSSEKSFY